MFEGLIGNEDVKAILTRLRVSGRIPNALLFAGEEGVGKREFALELARSFLCRDEATDVACGTCSPCTRSMRLNVPDSEKKDDFERVHFSDHADLGLVVAHNKNILVDAIRSLHHEAYFRPFEAPARFFLIDDAHKMNDAASNALLKTLEEPSDTSHIFLITSRPDSLLQTIRSRCQTVRFSPVSAGEIEGHLIAHRKLSRPDATLVARLSHGSVGRAVDFDLADFRERRESVLRTLQAASVGNTLELLKVAEDVADAKNKERFEDFLETLQTVAHDVWLLSLGESRERIVNIDIIDRLSAWAESVDRKTLVAWMEETARVQASLAVNVNKKIATDALFMKMAGI